MKFEANLKEFATRLLQDRLDGKLKDPKDVAGIALEIQPLNGFSNNEWAAICDFILLIEKADNIPAAKKLADSYGLVIQY